MKSSLSSSAVPAFRNVKRSVILHKICTSVTREVTGILHYFIAIEVKTSKNMDVDDKQHVCKFT